MLMYNTRGNSTNVYIYSNLPWTASISFTRNIYRMHNVDDMTIKIEYRRMNYLLKKYFSIRKDPKLYLNMQEQHTIGKALSHYYKFLCRLIRVIL